MLAHSVDTIKVQFREPMHFIGAIYRNMGVRLLTRTKVTQRQHHQGSHQHE